MKKHLPQSSSNKAKAFCFVLAICLLIVCIPVGYAANDRRLKRKYERALDLIQIGDSKQRVISLMGQPDDREWCYPLPTPNDSPERKKFHEQCVDQFKYVTFLEWYLVAFDKDGQVSWKGRSVSP